MASAPWQPEWWRRARAALACNLWRGVEAQHRVATMKLVDTLDEQAVLEQLLEDSKPPLPAGRSLHYLLNTPFRYRSVHASRFRAGSDPGIWYGAESLHTACTEVAYWRWRFLLDSDGLRDGHLISEHTFFQARVRGRAVDLTAAPWNAAADRWTDGTDYSDCQHLAREARSRDIQWIRYRSVREPAGYCGAVLDPACLSLPQPMPQQTWVCKVTRERALMMHDQDSLSLAFPQAGVQQGA